MGCINLLFSITIVTFQRRNVKNNTENEINPTKINQLMFIVL